MLTLTTLTLTAGLTGCFDQVSAESYRDVQRKKQLAEERVQQLEDELATLQQSQRTLEAQVARLRGLDSQDAMNELIFPDRIALEGMSGGYDQDGEPGDDGIVVFVQPIDRDGHVVKAAGSLRVRILDLANAPNRNLVAEYYFDVPTTRSLWYGRMWTHHFTVRCPWPTGQIPMHSELTARVEFTDLLTGRVLTDQAVYEVTLPPVKIIDE